MEAWDHDHREVAKAFDGEAQFAEALRAVAPPLKLPAGKIRRETERWGSTFVYRGVLVPPDHEPANHAEGIAWTFDRDIAAWFAMRHRGSRDWSPFVFQLEVATGDIITTHNGRKEAEAIIDPVAFTGTMTVDIDGTEANGLTPGARASAEALASWQEAADRWEAVMTRFG
jgi:hypothetical protein